VHPDVDPTKLIDDKRPSIEEPDNKHPVKDKPYREEGPLNEQTVSEIQSHAPRASASTEMTVQQPQTTILRPLRPFVRRPSSPPSLCSRNSSISRGSPRTPPGDVEIEGGMQLFEDESTPEEDMAMLEAAITRGDFDVLVDMDEVASHDDTLIDTTGQRVSFDSSL
jgi:hypothetical protein